jgi:DNA-directed RNA polymerase specialized sigma subunit
MLTRKLCVNADAEANNVKVQSLTRTIIREQRFRWYRVLFEDDWAQKISDIVEIVKGTSLWDFLTDKLVPRNKYILHAYVIDKRTQKSIAQELNLSTAYIHQRINSALWRIQWRIRHNTQLTEIFGLKDKGRPYRIRSYD